MRTWLRVSIALPLLGLAWKPVTLSANHDDPVAVLDARQAAYGVHNLDAAMAFFADDAVVTVLVGTPRQTQYVGKEQIRRWQEALLREQNVRVETVGARRVEGDTVTWTAMVSRAEWQTTGIGPLELWGEAIVRDGKIRSLRNGLTPASAAKLDAAAARRQGK